MPTLYLYLRFLFFAILLLMCLDLRGHFLYARLKGRSGWISGIFRIQSDPTLATIISGNAFMFWWLIFFWFFRSIYFFLKKYLYLNADIRDNLGSGWNPVPQPCLQQKYLRHHHSAHRITFFSLTFASFLDMPRNRLFIRCYHQLFF